MKKPDQDATLKTSQRAGFTLLETLIAVAILAIITAGIFSLLFATQQLWSNGFAISKTSMETRKIYDRMILSIYQSPNAISEPMRIIDSSNPAILERVMDSAQPALAFATVVGGPLQVSDVSGVAGGGQSMTLEVPPLDTTHHEYSIAQRQADAGVIQIRPDDYAIVSSSNARIFNGMNNVRRITAASTSGATSNSWQITVESSFDLSVSPDSITADSWLALTILRYSAFVVLEDLPIEGDVKDALVQYDGLQVLDEVDARPTRIRLPANFRTSYDRVVSSSLVPHTYAAPPLYPNVEYDPDTGNTSPIVPFYRSYQEGDSQNPVVRVRVAVGSGDFTDVIKIGDMSRYSNFDSEIYLRSGNF